MFKKNVQNILVNMCSRVTNTWQCHIIYFINDIRITLASDTLVLNEITYSSRFLKIRCSLFSEIQIMNFFVRTMVRIFS